MEISTYIRASVVAFEFGPLAASDKFSGQRRCVTRYCSVVSNAPHRCETYKLDCFSYTGGLRRDHIIRCGRTLTTALLGLDDGRRRLEINCSNTQFIYFCDIFFK